ncbi:MAG: GC-type dockerin domain-anchored protein [Phycisphaerales bacterium]
MPTLRTVAVVAAMALLACGQASAAPPQRLADLPREPQDLSILTPAVAGGEKLGWITGNGLLIITGGTPANTETLTLIEPANQQPLQVKQLLILPDRLYFVATTTISPVRLYTCGRHGGPVVRLSAPDSSVPAAKILAPLGTGVVYTASSAASTGVGGSDGTAQGTTLLAPFASTVPIFETARLGNRLFFASRNTPQLNRMWVTDGTPAGTYELFDPASGIATGVASGPAVIADRAYFISGTSASGAPQLWKSDGTVAGTEVVATLPTTALRPDTQALPTGTSGVGTAYFSTYGTGGNRLIATDGTEPGTILLTSTGTNSVPSSMVMVGDRLYFTTGGAVYTARRVGAEAPHFTSVLSSLPLSPAAFGGQFGYCFSSGLIAFSADGTSEIVVPAAGGALFQRAAIVTSDEGVLFSADGATDLGRWALRREGTNQNISSLLSATSYTAGFAITPVERIGDRVAFPHMGGNDRNMYFTDGSVARTLREPYGVWWADNSSTNDRFVTVGDRLIGIQGTFPALLSTAGAPDAPLNISGTLPSSGTSGVPPWQAQTLFGGRRVVTLGTYSFLTDGTIAGTQALPTSGRMTAINQIAGTTYLLDTTGTLYDMTDFPAAMPLLASFGSLNLTVSSTARALLAAVNDGFIVGRFASPGTNPTFVFIDPAARTSTTLGAGFSGVGSDTAWRAFAAGGVYYWRSGTDSTSRISVIDRSGIRDIPTLAESTNPLDCAASGRAIGRTVGPPSAVWALEPTSTTPTTLLSSTGLTTSGISTTYVLSRRPVTRALIARLVIDVGFELYSTNGTAAGTFRVGTLPPELLLGSTSVGDILGSKYIFTAGLNGNPYAWIPCPADVASLGGDSVGDGRLTIDDIVTYLAKFFENSTGIADLVSIGGDGVPDGQLTPDDLIFFLQSFFAGCP